MEVKWFRLSVKYVSNVIYFVYFIAILKLAFFKMTSFCFVFHISPRHVSSYFPWHIFFSLKEMDWRISFWGNVILYSHHWISGSKLPYVMHEHELSFNFGTNWHSGGSVFMSVTRMWTILLTVSYVYVIVSSPRVRLI